MKFSMGIKKHSRASIGIAEGHNTRMHPTKSQLPRSAWLSPEGRIDVVAWRGEQVDAARALARRKDAVTAIELVLQVGDQTHWREMPTAEHPHGKPKAGMKAKMRELALAASEVAIKEFGAGNVVGIDLHLDESSPHVHIVVTPITTDGKLQAKKWLDGKATCAKLRRRIHDTVNRRVPCTYTPGEPGGEPHDPQKAAGGPSARKPAPGLAGAAMEALTRISEVKELKGEVETLGSALQQAFSRNKRLELDLAASRAREADARAEGERKVREERERAERERADWTQRAARWDREKSELMHRYADADNELKAIKRGTGRGRRLDE
jgi:hypothetical protein